LNDIHFTFFVITTLYWLCLYQRHGRWWMGAGAGLSLGLGLLVKEFMLLLLPLFLWAFMWQRSTSLRWRIVSLSLALVLATLVVLPWVMHVRSVTGSPVGGVARRGGGQAAKVLVSERAWGLRSPTELWKMVTFYDKPAWITQVLFIVALFYCGFRCLKNPRSEAVLLIAAIMIFYLTFAVFKALPLNLRRLLPLLPIYSILIAILLDHTWEKRDQVARLLRDRRRWTQYGMLILLAAFLVNNLKPQRVFAGFRPFAILSSNRAPLLRDEVKEAVGCIPPGVPVLTNYKSLMYFYSQGRHPVRALSMTQVKTGRPWMKKSVDAEPERTSSRVIYDFTIKDKRRLMDEDYLFEQIRESDAEFLVFFKTNMPKQSPKALVDYLGSRPDRFAVECENRGYSVYRLTLSVLEQGQSE
jgi:hypothetical protein